MNSKQESPIRIIGVVLIISSLMLHYFKVSFGADYHLHLDKILLFAGIFAILLQTLPPLFRNSQNIKVFYNKDTAERLRGRAIRVARTCLISLLFIMVLWAFDPKGIRPIIPTLVIIIAFSFLQPNFTNAKLLIQPDGLKIIFRRDDVFLAWHNVHGIKFSPGIRYLPIQHPNMDIVMKDGNIYKLVLLSSRWHYLVKREDAVTEQLSELPEAVKIPIWINGVQYSLT